MRAQNIQSNSRLTGQNDEQKTVDFQSSGVSLTWTSAWKMPSFRGKFIIGLVILAGILVGFPFFFNVIEHRVGFVFNDLVLRRIPAHNVSAFVFLLIWSSFILLVVRMFRDPLMLLVMLWSYNGVTILRMACIGLISLNPPEGLIPLADPITNHFYGGRFITHDLFFSGHTTSVFLIFLCLKKQEDRIFTLFASMILGILLLVQHVHYTIDVLAAPFFTYAVYRLVLLFTKRENELANSGPVPAKGK